MDDWKLADPTVLGFNDELLSSAIKYAITHESKMDRDIGAALARGHFEEPSHIGKTIGPVKPRKAGSGAILRNGRLIKTWGDVNYVDMSFSITKSYLSLCTGVALKNGIISDVHEPVREIAKDIGFESSHNKDITWAQLLQLTSEWEGTLWGKPDWIDHHRDLNSSAESEFKKGTKRVLQKPGTYWEYNDVRVNQLSLALMLAFRCSLQEVLKKNVMEPIGATDTWFWHGYENSWVEVEGKKLQAVSGGAHWGGGLWISTMDQARVGQLMLNKGYWNKKEIIPKSWIEECVKPCPLAPNYGYLWWLNHPEVGMFPEAPNSAYFALGVGTQIMYVDPENCLVIIVRWIEKNRVAKFIHLVLESLKP